MYIHVNVCYTCVSCDSHVVHCYLVDRPDGPDDDDEVSYYSDEDAEQDQVLSEYMTLVIHEMLRKTRQGNTTQQKDKATQHNWPKQLFFKEKLAASGGT